MVGLQRSLLLCLGLALAALTTLGCKSKSETTPAPAPSGAASDSGGKPNKDDGPFAAGIKVFNDTCFKCHALGPSGPGKKINLAALDANKDAAWIKEHVRNPKTHNPNSKMPAFAADQVSDENLKTLAEYIVSLNKK
jgi:mono/diheme cytochrome c family protein